MSNPTQYQFSYKVDIKLKNGRIFPRSGIITGIHARHAKDKLLKKFPGTEPKVEPHFDGKLSGSDLAFQEGFKGKKYVSKIN